MSGQTVAWFKSCAFKSAEKAYDTELCKEFETPLSLYHRHSICVSRSVPLHWTDSLALVGREVEERRSTKLRTEHRDEEDVFMSPPPLAFIWALSFSPFLHPTKTSYCCVLSKRTVLHWISSLNHTRAESSSKPSDSSYVTLNSQVL